MFYVSVVELIDMALIVTKASTLSLDLNLHPVLDIDDQLALIVKLNDTQHHASMLSHFLLNNSLYFGVLNIISFQNILTKLHKKNVANLNKQ